MLTSANALPQTLSAPVPGAGWRDSPPLDAPETGAWSDGYVNWGNVDS